MSASISPSMGRLAGKFFKGGPGTQTKKSFFAIYCAIPTVNDFNYSGPQFSFGSKVDTTAS